MKKVADTAWFGVKAAAFAWFIVLAVASCVPRNPDAERPPDAVRLERVEATNAAQDERLDGAARLVPAIATETARPGAAYLDELAQQTATAQAKPQECGILTVCPVGTPTPEWQCVELDNARVCSRTVPTIPTPTPRMEGSCWNMPPELWDACLPILACDGMDDAICQRVANLCMENEYANVPLCVAIWASNGRVLPVEAKVPDCYRHLTWDLWPYSCSWPPPVEVWDIAVWCITYAEAEPRCFEMRFDSLERNDK